MALITAVKQLQNPTKKLPQVEGKEKKKKKKKYKSLEKIPFTLQWPVIIYSVKPTKQKQYQKIV